MFDGHGEASEKEAVHATARGTSGQIPYQRPLKVRAYNAQVRVEVKHNLPIAKCYLAIPPQLKYK